MNAKETCITSDITEQVLDRHAINEAEIPGIIFDLTNEIQTAFGASDVVKKVRKARDDTRLQWNWDTRQAA